jgi:hypothetical protein
MATVGTRVDGEAVGLLVGEAVGDLVGLGVLSVAEGANEGPAVGAGVSA